MKKVMPRPKAPRDGLEHKELLLHGIMHRIKLEWSQGKVRRFIFKNKAAF